MNVLLLLAHSIAEYDDLRMLTDLGYDAWSIGAYSDPAQPGDAMRPPLAQAAQHPELQRLVIEQREQHAGQDQSWVVDWAKADLHPGIIDWADVIVCHHYLDRWIIPQWDRIKHKQVVWRTCGQSNPDLEEAMLVLRRDGLRIVRYSPNEVVIPGYAGADALIRFGKYPADYGPWHGEWAVVGNLTQDLAGRGDFTGYHFWLEATEGLPAKPAGPGSEVLPGGMGALSYPEMLDYLRAVRVYLYTGTVPAPYTLGLIEAMLSGTPVISIGPGAWYGPAALFEGASLSGVDGFDDPRLARALLQALLESQPGALAHGARQRERAIELFDVSVVGPQWQAFLG